MSSFPSLRFPALRFPRLRSAPAGLAALAFGLTLGLALPAAACIKPKDAAAQVNRMLAEVNAQRKANGLGSVALSAPLTAAAQGQACDTADQQKAGHKGSDGSTLGTRLKRQGYSYSKAAENASRGYSSASSAMAGWMKSSGHRKNTLSRGVTEVGIGLAQSKAPDSKMHWILVLAKPR